MKIGISLAGGGIKGAAHIGVLKALEERKIKIDMISGASSGSIVASLYAMGYTSNEIYTCFKKYAKEVKYADPSNIFKLLLDILIGNGIKISGLSKGKVITKYMNEKCGKKSVYKITDLKFPLYISSVDVDSGATYIFTNQKYVRENEMLVENNIDIPTAVRASCSFPGIFEPVKWNGKNLVDGGIRENIPWKILKKAGADKVISVIFKDNSKKECCKNIINVIDCSIGYIGRELQKYEVCGSDIIIPIEASGIGLLDSRYIDFLYNLGYKTTIEKL